MLIRGLVAQVNRARCYERRGCRFESCLALHVRRRGSSVDQERAPPKGQGGSSILPRASNYTWVGSQVAWQRAFNPLIVSSILTRPTSREGKQGSVTQLAEYPPLKRDVLGSMPSGSTIRGPVAQWIRQQVSNLQTASSSLARPSRSSETEVG